MLADTSDVEAMLGRPLAVGEDERAAGLLVLASAEVEAFTRRKFATGAYSMSRVVRSGRVRLPAAVAEVTAVRAINTDGSESEVAGYTVRGSTVYGLSGCEVVVDFTVTAAVPDPVVRVVAGMVAATLEAPPVGVSADIAGPFAQPLVASSGRIWMTKTDREILSRYALPKPAIAL